MALRKNVFTTGEVAKICNVAPRTVSKWFDAGHLRGYRIPGSKDRRIPLDQLVRFMKAHGIPLNGLEGGSTRILVLDGDRAFGAAIEAALGAERGYEISTATSAFEAGIAAHELAPHVLLVDVTLPDVTPKLISRLVRSTAALQATCLIGIARGMTEAQGQALLQDGFDFFLSKPFETRSLLQLIEEKLSGGAMVSSHVQPVG